MLVVDDARRFVDANPAACRLLGLAPKDLLGKRFDDFLDEPGLDLDAAWLNFLETGEQMGELRVVRPDGSAGPSSNAPHGSSPGAIWRSSPTSPAASVRRPSGPSCDGTSRRACARPRCCSGSAGPWLDARSDRDHDGVAREIVLAIGTPTWSAPTWPTPARQPAAVAGYHVPPEMIDDFRRHPIPIRGHPAIEQAWASRRSIWTDDMPGDARVDAETLARFPHQSDLFVPIRVKDRAVGGFFVIWWTERRSITEGEMRLLEGISDLAGIFLENAELYRDTSEANRAKDEFLATLSDELRNPLGAIANAVAALERRGGAEEAATRLRQIITGRPTI